MKKSAVAVLAGIALGVLGARYVFVGSWWNLVPWSVAGIALGFWGTRNESVLNGGAYGFVLSLAFLIAGYTGKLSLASRIPFFLVLGAFGAMCGVLLAIVGFKVGSGIARRRAAESKSS